MNRKKNIILIILIISFGLILAGGTYSYLSWTGTVTNSAYVINPTCFLIDYDYMNDDGSTTELSGTLFQSSVPKTGLSGKVSMAINQECDVCAEGQIYLQVNNTTSPVLYSKVNKAHCEDPSTLKTMTQYTTSSACTSAGYSWVNNVSALKYAVYKNVNSAPVSVGYIDGVKDITLYSGFNLKKVSTSYYVYIWLDGELADNSYLDVSFDGDIHLGADQTENCSIGSLNAVGEAYAVYSADDNSLRFYRSEIPITVGSTYNGLTVTEVYTGFENEYYTEEDICEEINGRLVCFPGTPWINSEYAIDITTVVFEDEIYPVSTAYWFDGFRDCNSLNLTKLDTSNVTDMRYMFRDLGSGLTEVNLNLSGLNTSNVIHMEGMFYSVGNSSSTSTVNLNLSGWNTSKVVDMSLMFQSVGAKASTINLNLSGWNTSNVTDMTLMFWYVGFWNGSSLTITGMENWNTSNVVIMDRMFQGTGASATTFDIGDLSNWNTSKVTSMDAMFDRAGVDATDWSLDLSSWNVCNVTMHDDFNLEVEDKITEPNWGMSCPSSANLPVLDYTGMIPVTIANDGTVTTVSKTDSSWYNYENKQWANAVLVKQNGTQQRSYYQTHPNETVNPDDILAYYVWIPKYKYKIWLKDGTTTSSPQEIDIVFEAKDTVTTGSEVGDYMTHPAFNFGGQNLSGIWVGKFETSASPDGDCFETPSSANCNNTTTEPRILPGVNALNYQYIANQFMTALKFSGGTMNSTSGAVTFAGSTTFGLANTTNSHMMKNSEWGAVAYLSHSKYGTCTNGICSEIRKNNYWSSSKSETGCGASESLANSTTTVKNCAIPYGGSTSYPQSTTGNISGVFDMSGGLHDGVMGNHNNTSHSTYFAKLPESKYYDVYSITSNSSCTLETCGGHALFETKGWYSDDTGFIFSFVPWFLRGGSFSDSTSTGAFFMNGNSGDSSNGYGFRSVLLVNGA